MKLEGIHHITCITADAPRNVDFYARVLGLRMIKKTVNFDRPQAYHLYYADEVASPGANMTFFEFPGIPPGRDGAGMIHRISWGVRSAGSLEFWADRLAAEGVEAELVDGRLAFADPDGLGLELAPAAEGNDPLVARSPDVPDEHAIVGFEGARAYATGPARSQALLTEALAFESAGGDSYRARGESRSAWWAYDPAPDLPGVEGAGTVHHIAWASRDEDHDAWRERALSAGARVTPIIDRQYFQSIYFREPSGVLFEIATLSPGFAIDEDPEHLGESLRLPPQHEHLREVLERTLTPLENPRAASRA